MNPTLTPAQVLAKEQAKAKREKLELAMAQQLKAAGLTYGLIRQYAFNEARRFRADFAWPHAMLLLEVDGGSWISGAHSRGSGIARDCEKGAHAAIGGYRVIHCTSNQVENGQALAWVAAALAGLR